jgi:integrase
LARDLVAALDALLRERGVGRIEQVSVFAGSHGRRLTRCGATHVVRRAAVSQHTTERARQLISPHVFRPSLAMVLMQSDVDLLTIQAWLGHAQVATTHRCLVIAWNPVTESIDGEPFEDRALRSVENDDLNFDDNLPADGHDVERLAGNSFSPARLISVKSWPP